MASDPSHADKPSMSIPELIAYTKKELDEHDQRQAKVAAGAGELPHDGATLDLSHKGIHALPEEIIALIKDKVARIALSHNPQIAIPTQIVQCDRLRYLNIRWNSLKYFPDAVLQLSSLEILDISKNRIIGIPEDIKKMSSLKFLAVARNKITRLPLALGEMNSLSKLKFDENPLEFPPPEALRPQEDRFAQSIETEKEKDVCQQVKRFLRQAALREKLRTNSEEDLSESNVETPRPPKRTLGGRFPVRPSISGMDSLSSPSETTPSVPQRSHSRVTSQTGLIPTRRPGIAPLLTGNNDLSRSRSETVSSSASLRSRRQGFVPNKPNRNLTPNNTSPLPLSRSSSAATIKPQHSKTSSIASSLNGYLAASNGGEPSGATSPGDHSKGRYNNGQGLASLPESRNSRIQTSDVVEAGGRLLHLLSSLTMAISPVINASQRDPQKRMVFERKLGDAYNQLGDLGGLLRSIANNEETGVKREKAAFRDVVVISMAALKSYAGIVATLRHHIQPSSSGREGMYQRELMMRAFYAMTEARNICKFLGVSIKSVEAPRARSSKSWSSRTVTPTQIKPVNGRRMRAATIRRNSSSFQRAGAKLPPVPLNGSRSNTMTSISSATPRSGESYMGPISSTSSAVPSRTNTMRSITHEDEHEQFEGIYSKLRHATNTAAYALPECHGEFTHRKEHAESLGQSRAADQWSLTLTKCDSVAIANSALMSRLANVKLNDPIVRSSREFWYHCDSFVQSWADLATEVKNLGLHRIDITHLKTLMKPVQRAVKDVSKIISDSSLYQAALRPPLPYPPQTSTTPPSFLATGVPPTAFSSFNSSFGTSVVGSVPQSATGSGYTTPVPATPLSAALGPAVQATVASGLGLAGAQGEYFSQSTQSTVRPSHGQGQGYGQGYGQGMGQQGYGYGQQYERR